MPSIIFTALLALAVGFVLAALAGRRILPILRKKHVGQQVRDDGPKSHYKKSGTPTFGGAIFLIPFTVLVLGYLAYDFSWQGLLFLLFVLGHAAIGFADDYVKVRKTKEGLSPKQKTVLLVALQTLFIIIYLFVLKDKILFVLPFKLGTWEIQGGWKILYGLFLLFYFYACTNAVNITDGVDGLASTVSAVVLAFLGITAIFVHYRGGYGSQNMNVFVSFALAGCLLGFLLFNWHKAKVFMGDFGSLALGAAISAIFLQEYMPLAFLLGGIIYVIEIMSVFIQVQYFRHTGGKRIFLMSPIHHHYELKGWAEEKIVIIFSLVTLVGCLLAGLVFWPGF